MSKILDFIDGEEYEGVFLKRITSKFGIKNPVFVIDPDDEAAFSRNDVITKLSLPRIVQGSTRRSCRLSSNIDLTKWDIN